jgi:putative Ca2+/H+ antiporter (TMEM165/GDT1 family)
MSKSIIVTVPHNLPTAEARCLIAAEIEHLRSAFVDRLARSDVAWNGDRADISVIALAQEIKARIDVMAESVRIEIVLPWLLASLAGPIQERLSSTTRETLALGHRPKLP